MGKTGRFDYGRVQAFRSTKHPFKEIKDVWDYSWTQRSTFPRRKQQKQQLGGHWGKRNHNTIEKWRRWKGGGFTREDHRHLPPQNQTQEVNQNHHEWEKKYEWSQNYKTHLPTGEPWPNGVLPEGFPVNCLMTATITPLSMPSPDSLASRILSSSIQSPHNWMWRAGYHDPL